MKLEGIYTPIITPFNEDGTFNLDALADVIEYLVESGVHGIFSSGSTGENYTQTVEERLELFAFTKDRVKGRVPLFLGVGATLTIESLALAEGAKEQGADGILVASPPYAVPTEEENALNVLAIDEAANLPIVLYNYPGRTGVHMGEDFLNRVSASPNLSAIKESSGDINRVHLISCEYPNIDLSCGMDDQALEFFAWGARSWICAGSNFLSTEHNALYQACAVEGDYDKGRKIMMALMPLMSVLEQGGKFVQCVKYGVELMGIPAGPPRLPLQPLEEEEKQQLEQVVSELKTAMAGI